MNKALPLLLVLASLGVAFPASAATTPDPARQTFCANLPQLIVKPSADITKDSDRLLKSVNDYDAHQVKASQVQEQTRVANYQQLVKYLDNKVATLNRRAKTDAQRQAIAQYRATEVQALLTRQSALAEDAIQYFSAVATADRDKIADIVSSRDAALEDYREYVGVRPTNRIDTLPAYCQTGNLTLSQLRSGFDSYKSRTVLAGYKNRLKRLSARDTTIRDAAKKRSQADSAVNAAFRATEKTAQQTLVKGL